MIIGINIIKIYYNNETINPFSQLKTIYWFWIRNLVQFLSVIPMLYFVGFIESQLHLAFVSIPSSIIKIMSCIILKEKFFWRYVFGVIVYFSVAILIFSNEYKKKIIQIKKVEFYI